MIIISIDDNFLDCSGPPIRYFFLIVIVLFDLNITVAQSINAE
jgi:hypothetical protein